MTPSLTDRLTAALHAVQDSRRVLAVEADPVMALRLDMEAQQMAAGAGYALVGADTLFKGVPLRESARPGVWVILAEEGDLPAEFEV